LINVAYFSNQFADAQGFGISRYARELHRALTTRKPGDIDPPLGVTPVAAWSSLGGDKLSAYQRATGLELLPLGRRLTPVAWTFFDAPPLEKLVPGPVDLVHAASLGYPVSTRKPLVVTVHDLGPLTQPDFFTNTRPWVMRRSLARLLAKTGHAICVSRSTADELLSYAGAGIADRVHVIHEGVSPVFTPAPAAAEELPCNGQPYILSTGKISPRKNIASVIAAFAAVAERLPHHLVLAGGDGWDVEEVHRIASTENIRARIHFAGFVTDSRLRALYAGASVYVHPSLYEGFGLTVLEAMACGCPVITSDRSSLPEVAGDAALLVDPLDTDAIAVALRQVCDEPRTATELREKGLRHARGFTWERCALETAEVYRRALR
jgi:glycosyltransferase involved in cell wall biosynthesis